MSWSERSTSWAERHRLAVDAATAAALGLVLVPLAHLVARSGNHPALFAAALVVPLAWRRVRPVASVVAVYLIGLVQLVAGEPFVLVADVAVLVALYSVTVHGPPWAHRTAAATGVVGFAAAGARLAADQRGLAVDLRAAVAVTTFGAVVVLAVWAFGLLRRSRVEQLDALRERAERLEVERDQQARIATAAERTRIARELHDIVAHSLSVMVAQADGGRYAAPTDPAAAVRSLETVGETGRAALADMRRLLGVLRTDDPAAAPRRPGLLAEPAAVDAGRAPAPGAAPRSPAGAPDEPSAPGAGPGTGPGAQGAWASAALRAPQPGLGGLDTLVAQVRAAGPRVSLVRVGTPRELPPGAGLAVFRVAQEALTNVLKHAGPGPQVTVVLRWDPDALVLDVQDDGRGAAADETGTGPGFGIVGMHERAAVFGGTVTTGPRAGGGFRVRLVLPTAALGSGGQGGGAEAAAGHGAAPRAAAVAPPTPPAR